MLRCVHAMCCNNLNQKELERQSWQKKNESTPLLRRSTEGEMWDHIMGLIVVRCYSWHHVITGRVTSSMKR